MNFNSSNKILLITYHPLSRANGGTIMYQSLIENFPAKNLFWIGTGSFLEEIPVFIKKSTKKSLIIRSVIFSPFCLRVFSKSFFSFINTFLLYFIYSPFAFLRILFFIRHNRITHVWFETFRHTYMISFLLHHFVKIKFHYSFNDHYSAHTKWPETLLLRMLLKKIIVKGSSFDFISLGMLNYFKQHYHFYSDNYMLLWITQTPAFSQPFSIRAKLKKIIFFGSIHGFDTFHSFCNYVDTCSRFNNSIEFDIYSQFDYSFFEKKYRNVRFLGYLSQQALSQRLYDYDIVYVPMHFSSFQVVSQTSLSSKMILAAALGIPIFCHGPYNSENVSFVTRHNLGVTCNFLDLKSIDNSFSILQGYETRKRYNFNAIAYQKSVRSISDSALELYQLILS